MIRAHTVGRDLHEPGNIKAEADFAALTGTASEPVREVIVRSDAELIEAVRSEPPDTEALDALVGRHWKPLFARCRLLTLDPAQARKLAECALQQILESRRSLSSTVDFRDYLIKTATQLWREQIGPDQTRVHKSSAENVCTLTWDHEESLARDFDSILRRLSPMQRDVMLSHFLDDESPETIGRRYNQPPQTVSRWLDNALQLAGLHR
jgi:DNA-directed RNA polymerase specialized sigma24 family protein